MIHKLDTEFDFIEANNATQKTLQKLKESEKSTTPSYSNHDDDFDDDFNDYKAEIAKVNNKNKGGPEPVSIKSEDMF